MTALSSTSMSPNRLLGTRTRGTVSAQEVHQGGLDDVRRRLERRLVGGLLGAEVDHRLGDVYVLGLRELSGRRLLDLAEAAERRVEPVRARAVDRADGQERLEV